MMNPDLSGAPLTNKPLSVLLSEAIFVEAEPMNVRVNGDPGSS
jgi:hypothetical protein